MSEWTRRSYLHAGIAASGLCAGCLGGDSGAYEAATADLPPIEPRETSSADVVLAHWFSGDAFAPLADLTSHDVNGSTAPDRRSHERAVADALVAGTPPDLFQTVLGEELRRYHRVKAIESIPTVGPELDDGTVVDLTAIDGEPYGVPLTATPINGLLVGESVDSPPETVAGLVEAAATHHLAIPRRAERVLQLLELVLAGVRGRRAHGELREGSIGVAALREAVDLVLELLAATRWLPADPSLRQFDEADLVLPGPDLLGTVLHARWRWIPFPGTQELAILQGTGIVRPIRGNVPGPATELLVAMASPSVQRPIGDRVLRVPAVSPPDGTAPGLASLATQRRDADRLLPALATGCGLDPDRRWRAIQRLEPAPVIDADADDIVADLRGALLRR